MDASNKNLIIDGVAYVEAEPVGALYVVHDVAIKADASGTLTVQPKDLAGVEAGNDTTRGDVVRWTCDHQFIVQFTNGKGPNGADPWVDTFQSRPPDTTHRKHWCEVPIKNYAPQTLIYEVLVKRPDEPWVNADPSIIIDISRPKRRLLFVAI